MTVKRCSKCGESKPLDDFHRCRAKSHGRAAYCRGCTREVQRDWRAANPLLQRQYARRALLKRYGLSAEQFDALLVAQAGRCDICSDPLDDALHIDHCHATGSVRGLLCIHCNTGIGKLRDRPALLRAAADYLERHSE